MTIQENDTRKEVFLGNLDRFTTPRPEIGLIKIFYQGKLLLIYRNIPGQAGTVRVISNLVVNNKLDYQACQSALKIYEPFVSEAIAFVGKHPAIDLILAVSEGDCLDIEIINFNNEELLSQQKSDSILFLVQSGAIKVVEQIYNYTTNQGKINLGDARFVKQQYIIDFLINRQDLV